MAQQPRASTETLQSIAQDMGKTTAPKKFESSTKNILKRLNANLYNISTEDPFIPRVVLIDCASAKLRNDIQAVDTNTLMKSVGDVNLTLVQINNSRSTSAFYSGYQQRSGPLINEASQRQLQKEELATAINNYIEDMQTKLSNISNEKKQGKSAREIRQILADLSKQAANSSNRVTKLEINVDSLQQNLDHLHREMTTLLPAQERKVTEEEVRRERLGGRGEY